MHTNVVFFLTAAALVSRSDAFAPASTSGLPRPRQSSVTSSSATTNTQLGMKLPKILRRNKDTPAETELLDEYSTEADVKSVPESESDEKKEGAEMVEEKTQEADEKTNLMSKIKAAGAAGAISLFLWEAAFWAISIPVAIFGYTSVAGSFPDWSNKEDVAKVGAEAFAFANVARFALPLRIGLAVSTTPWVQDNIVDTPWVQETIVDRFFNKEKTENKE